METTRERVQQTSYSNEFQHIDITEDPVLLQLIHYLELSGEKFLDGQFDEDISFLNEPHALWVRSVRAREF